MCMSGIRRIGIKKNVKGWIKFFFCCICLLVCYKKNLFSLMLYYILRTRNHCMWAIINVGRTPNWPNDYETLFTIELWYTKGIGRHQNDGDFNGHFKHIILIGFFGFQINLKANIRTRLGLIPFKLTLIVILGGEYASNYISYCHVLKDKMCINIQYKQQKLNAKIQCICWMS